MLITTSLISPEVYEQDFIVRLLTTTGSKTVVMSRSL